MSPNTFKTLSFFAAILSGLIPAAFLVFGSVQIFGTVRATEIGGGPATPSDPFVIGFSEPVSAGSLDGKISLSPNEPFHIAWNDARTVMSVRPGGKWSSGGSYRITVDGGKTGIAKTIPMASFSFDVPGYPEVLSVTPEDGTTDVLLDIEDPIVVTFDTSVKAHFIDFRLTPSIPVSYENNSDKTEFRILPKTPLSPDTKYTLSVSVKWRGEDDEAFLEIRKVSFSTLAEKPFEWEKDIVLRAAQAKKYAQALKPSGRYIDINLAIQIMTIFENGIALDSYPVSTGKPGMETPKGEYLIRNKTPRAWSAAYGLFMPNWMALVPDGKFGIHELPEWPGGYKEGANHLGVPVSHGCVRLGVGPAKRVYDWTDIGTAVVVH